MNSADILNAMTLLPENMVEEAAEHKFKKKSHILRYAGFAAAVVVCVAGIFAVRSGQSSPNAGSGSGGAALASMDDSAFFNIMLHLATLIAVVIAYWSDVRDMAAECAAMIRGAGREDAALTVTDTEKLTAVNNIFNRLMAFFK